MSELYSYTENIKRKFGPGWEPRDLKVKQKELYELENKKKSWLQRAQRDQANYNKNPNDKIYQDLFMESADGLEKAIKKHEDLKSAIYRGDAFGTDMPSETEKLVSCEGELNLADIYNVRYDMTQIQITKNERIVVENYNDTTTCLTDEGNPIPKKYIGDCINVLKTDYSNLEKIADILNVPENMLSDDTDLLNGAIDSVQKKHHSNTETMLLCRAIQASKEAINIDAVSLSSVVNCHLCAKAKLLTEIITNESGFTKLDITDETGNPLVKKNFTLGQFVWGDKYIIRILSDDILPNNEDGSSPIFIGDWRNVLRLIIVKKYPPLIKVDVINCSVENRAVTYTIPILTTKSDKAFIVGYIN